MLRDGHGLEVSWRCFNLADYVTNDLAIFLKAEEQRWPLHQVGQIEADVVVLSVWIEVAEVQVKKVSWFDASNYRHSG